ncbi:7364_t:CDS:2 [Paraglomus brasilianum]|uniref:7364_t:CDS:1 n=1 Tax=Paraglomus brasilianum TaxID=144538 RepID=A0A9N9F3K9_9GLOM|nr:7364_t:CDS:2 [Paraglomus brasilianum]
MSNSQARPTTPLTEYGPSLTPPTAEEINLCYLSAESNENNAPLRAYTTENAIVTTETGEADSIYSSDSVHVSPCAFISVYLALIVNAILMSAGIIILISLIMYANNYKRKRMALITWCIMESVFRLWAVYITAKKSSATYTMTHWLGIFLGKEHYLLLVNSLWPDSVPFTFDAVECRDLRGVSQLMPERVYQLKKMAHQF